MQQRRTRLHVQCSKNLIDNAINLIRREIIAYLLSFSKPPLDSQQTIALSFKKMVPYIKILKCISIMAMQRYYHWREMIKVAAFGKPQNIITLSVRC